MRHRVAGRKLGRTTAHRQALLRNLGTALIEKEKITTTLAKAKELRRFAEKLITLSKKETLHARRRALQKLPNRRAVAKLFDSLSARYAQRPGGYTRILKLGPRRSDNAEMALIEFVSTESPAAEESKETRRKGKRAKTTKKKKTAAKTTKKAPAKRTAAADEGTRKKKTKKTKTTTRKRSTKAAAAAEDKPKPKRKRKTKAKSEK
jgi:large subunit ribosomal protein L17